MKPRVRWGFSILLLTLAFAALQPALAYNYPLSPEAIREAYFLGKGGAAKRAEVFGKYTQDPPAPKTGPHVSMIQFETPYLVVAENISQNSTNYYAPDAEEQYLGKPAICRVRVEVDYTIWQELEPPPVIPGAFRFQTGDIGSDLSILLKQGKKRNRSSSGSPLGPGFASWRSGHGPLCGIGL
jgi:hypothetical protein